MVAPVLRKGPRERRVVFQKGQWKYKDLNILGGEERVFSSPLGELLIFERIK